MMATNCCSKGMGQRRIERYGMRRSDTATNSVLSLEMHRWALLKRRGNRRGAGGLIEAPEFQFMRPVLFAALSVVGLLSTLAPSSSALARTRKPAAAIASIPLIQDRYCLQGRDLGYPGNCEFSTYDQCMATASGTNAYCGINPQYLFAEQRRGYRPSY